MAKIACTKNLKASVLVANGLSSNPVVITRSWAIMVSQLCWVFHSVSAEKVNEFVQVSDAITVPAELA